MVDHRSLIPRLKELACSLFKRDALQPANRPSPRKSDVSNSGACRLAVAERTSPSIQCKPRRQRLPRGHVGFANQKKDRRAPADTRRSVSMAHVAQMCYIGVRSEGCDAQSFPPAGRPGSSSRFVRQNQNRGGSPGIPRPPDLPKTFNDSGMTDPSCSGADVW